jgi:CheY-like chemotaxis protein/anti-sigma regulatory factor (Ser/Thr protein kinase)
LLDISKIEAGHFHLYRDKVRIHDFLDQIVDMFRLQAAAQGIDFFYDRRGKLPVFVYVDEKRIRQILINLLSNAVKYTETGYAALRVSYRSQVAEFEIEDTGIGIRAEDIDRIFEPFERGQMPNVRTVPGTGLGLTITKLLTEIMGGAISVTSEPGKGSVFRVKLFLSEATDTETLSTTERPISGYQGRRLTVLVADDDASHVELIHELLVPLGFIVFSASDGPSCLTLAEQCEPDLFLLDISMPGMRGWEVARKLREAGHDRAAIIIISANADEFRLGNGSSPFHDNFLIKPIDVQQLLDQIQSLLKIEWLHERAEAEIPPSVQVSLSAEDLPNRRHVEDLRQLGRIGYVRGIEAKLRDMEAGDPGNLPFVTEMRALVQQFDLKQYMAILEALLSDDR